MTRGSIPLGSVLAAALLAAVPAHAAEPAFGDAELPGYTFADGQSLPSLRLHYATLGTPRRDAAGTIVNAVLLLHGTTGIGQAFLQPPFQETLYGPGQPLDTSRFYLVIPDGIGLGGSSKPSDGLHARFPKYGYVDQVRSQRALLQSLGIAHLKLVLGTSMGGMQTWLWAETYPDMADAFVPIASTPSQISGRNQVWREMIAQAIRDDPDWKGGDYPKDHPPRDWIRAAMPLFSIMTSNATALQRQAPTRARAKTLVDAIEAKAATRDANDFLYRFESSYDYDPAPRLGAIVKPVLTINFADDLLNPPELMHLPAGANFTHVMLPAGATYGHETLAHPDVWVPVLRDFLDKVPGWRTAPQPRVHHRVRVNCRLQRVG